METNGYNILWLEDEPDSESGGMSAFEELAYDEGFTLTHAETVEDAVEKVRNGKLFHGAILDAKGVVKRGHSSSLGALTQALTKIRALDKDLPIVVYTGQKDDSDIWRAIEVGLDEVVAFKKGAEQDEMFEQLKVLIEKRPQNSLRKKYSEVFSFCEKETELGEDCLNCLEHCLLHIEYGQELGGLQPYNDLRQIVERLARVYKERGLLPAEFGGGQVEMPDWINFWCGTHRDYQFEKGFPFLPSVFSENLIHLFTRVGNSGSHTSPKEGEEEQRELVNGIADATDGDHHLIHIATYLTIDLLKMAKVTVEKELYFCPEQNGKLWSRWEGRLVKDQNGYWEIKLLNEDATAWIDNNNPVLKKIVRKDKSPTSSKTPVYPSLKLNRNKKGAKYFAKGIKVVP